jgi:hypothetical protein
MKPKFWAFLIKSGETDRNGKNVPAVSSLADKLWWDK